MQEPPATPSSFMAQEVCAVPICPAPAVPPHPTSCGPAQDAWPGQSISESLSSALALGARIYKNLCGCVWGSSG